MHAPPLPSFASTLLATLLIGSSCHSPPARSVGVTETTSANAPVLHHLASATEILTESVADDGRKIPIEAAARARCVAVVPNVFRDGELPAGQRANGIVTCRTSDGTWSKAGFFILSTGPTARRVDPSAIDLVILTHDANADVAFAGGPSKVTFLCYAHGAGTFSGTEIGAVYIKPDRAGIRAFYQDDRSMHHILAERAEAKGLAYPAAVARSFDHAHAVFFPQ
jgi:lipid-binding SYLF domain-containing protein